MIDPKRINLCLAIISALVVLLGVSSEVAASLGNTYARIVAPYFSLSFEANLPTWYSSVLLLGCAFLLACVASGAAGQKMVNRWWVLSIGFLLMSIDEVMSLHELTGLLIRGRGLLHFSWVIPASVLLMLLGAYFLPFLRALPALTRNRFLIAGFMYVGGAVAMELPLGYWAEKYGDNSLGYGLIDAVEETLEIIGAQYFLVSLARELTTSGFTLRFGRKVAE